MVIFFFDVFMGRFKFHPICMHIIFVDLIPITQNWIIQYILNIFLKFNYLLLVLKYH